MFTWACYYQILGPIFQSLVLLISIGNSEEDSGFYSFEALFTIFFTVGVAITWILWVTNVRKLSPFQPNEDDNEVIEGNEDDSTRSAHFSDGYNLQSSNKYISVVHSIGNDQKSSRTLTSLGFPRGFSRMLTHFQI